MQKHIPLLALLFALLCLPGLPGQRLIDSRNDQPAGTSSGSMSAVIFCVQHQMKLPGLITAVEFWCGNSRPATGEVYIYDDLNGKPGTQLGKGTFTAPPAKAWAGAVLKMPALIKLPNQIIYVGFRLSTGGTITAAGRATTTPKYFHSTTGTSWNGPYSGWLWMYRLYGPGGTGKFTQYGTGKAGTHGTIGLEARGWPNTGNPTTLIASNMKAGAPGLLVWGRRVNIPLPLGPIYAFPPLAMDPFTTTASSKPVPQGKIFPLKIPGDTNLVGISFSWQIWLVDPGAAGGLANTHGLETLIG